MNRFHETGYSVHCIDHIDDPLDDYIDVQVTFDTGERYIASFLTLKNIQRAMDHWKEEGVCLSGTY